MQRINYLSTKLSMPCIFLADTRLISLYIPTTKYAMYTHGRYGADLLIFRNIKYALYIPVRYVTDLLISHHN